MNGKPVTIRDSQAAISAGIGMVHQHFMLVENFTVLENVMLGAEGGALLARGRAGARRELKRLEDDYGLEVDPDAVIEELPVGLQQRVEILKAMYRGAEILILDEPTGVLTPAEADHLFKILGVLREQGKTIILITHKLREIMAITDSVSVMRRGEMVATRKTSETSVEELAELMVGRRVLLRVEKGETTPGDVLLSIRNLTVKDSRGVTMVDDVSLDVAPVKSSALPVLPAMVSQSCWKLSPASASPIPAKSGWTDRRWTARIRPSCASLASPISRKTATIWGWC